MCNLGQAWFEEGKAEGRAEGKAEGKAEGRAEGRAEGKAEGRAEGKEEGIVKGLLRAIVSIVKHYGVTTEQAMADLGIPENMREEYKEMLEKDGVVLT